MPVDLTSLRVISSVRPNIRPCAACLAQKTGLRLGLPMVATNLAAYKVPWLLVFKAAWKMLFNSRKTMRGIEKRLMPRTSVNSAACLCVTRGQNLNDPSYSILMRTNV